MVSSPACGLAALAFFVSAVTVGCDAATVDTAEHPSEFVGKWARVYPGGPPDTLELGPDGAVLQVSSGIDDQAPDTLNHWVIGRPLMPGGFCIGYRPRNFNCQSYLLRNDTLALANLKSAVFIRAGAARFRNARATVPAAPVPLRIDAPRPGDGVKRSGPSGR